MTIGVAVSTHRRPHILARSLAQWATHSHSLDELVVIHDRDGDGVAVTKNRCITALMDLGCEHHFYADDDIFPITSNWAAPYVNNPQPHLMHCWGRSRFLRVDGDLTVWSWPRGPMLYVARRVIERVGGMRTEFGRWGGEHAEWSRRIHNAGLTPYPFIDAAAARRGVWHALDYERTEPSSIPDALRNDPQARARRHHLYHVHRHSAAFVQYR